MPGIKLSDLRITEVLVKLRLFPPRLTLTIFTLFCTLSTVVADEFDNGPINGEKIPASVIHQ